jgi:hypothetical protein
MNERIKELYQQAHMVREYHLDDPMRGGNPPTVYWGGDRSAERFAELILTEVTDILATYRMKAIFVDGIEYNCQHPIYAIRKHFGVES